jgi:hypothetical protein
LPSVFVSRDVPPPSSCSVLFFILTPQCIHPSVCCSATASSIRSIAFFVFVFSCCSFYSIV